MNTNALIHRTYHLVAFLTLICFDACNIAPEYWSNSFDCDGNLKCIITVDSTELCDEHAGLYYGDFVTIDFTGSVNDTISKCNIRFGNHYDQNVYIDVPIKAFSRVLCDERYKELLSESNDTLKIVMSYTIQKWIPKEGEPAFIYYLGGTHITSTHNIQESNLSIDFSCRKHEGYTDKFPQFDFNCIRQELRPVIGVKLHNLKIVLDNEPLATTYDRMYSIPIIKGNWF